MFLALVAVGWNVKGQSNSKEWAASEAPPGVHQRDGVDENSAERFDFCFSSARGDI